MATLPRASTSNNLLSQHDPLSQDEVDRITKYFADHGLEKFFVQMLIAVGRARPQCPFWFMCDYMEQRGIVRTQVEHAQETKLQQETNMMQSFVNEWRYSEGEEAREARESKVSEAHKKSADSKLKYLSKPAKAASRNLGSIFVDPDKAGDLRSNTSSTSRSKTQDIDKLLCWEMNPFEKTDDELMRYVYYIMDQGWNVTTEMNVHESTLKNYIATIHANYRAENSYHNFKHAFSVMTAVGILLREGGQEFLDEVQTFSALISGLTHDVGHPGFGTDYFVKAGHELAIRYNDIAVLENMHASLTFEIMRMPNNDILENFANEDFLSFRKTSVTSILSTDMKVHFDLTSAIQEYLDHGTVMDSLDLTQRTLYQRCLVHAGDLSNPVLPTELCKEWAYKVVLEFHAQAEKEKSEGLPFSPFMEHHPDNTLEFARLQVGFCSFVVRPFWTTLIAFFNPGATKSRLDQLEENVAMWVELKTREEQKQKDAEKEEKTGDDSESGPAGDTPATEKKHAE